MSNEIMKKIAEIMGCNPEDDDDLIEAVRLLVGERDAAETENKRLRERAEIAESMLSSQLGPDLDAHTVLLDTEAKMKKFAKAFARIEFFKWYNLCPHCQGKGKHNEGCVVLEAEKLLKNWKSDE
jgi:hypothetical protein